MQFAYQQLHMYHLQTTTPSTFNLFFNLSEKNATIVRNLNPFMVINYGHFNFWFTIVKMTLAIKVKETV